MNLLEVHTDRGGVRVCGPRCHDAKGPKRRSRCICGGEFRGIGSENAANVPVEHLWDVREALVLGPGETLQLRIGA